MAYLFKIFLLAICVYNVEPSAEIIKFDSVPSRVEIGLTEQLAITCIAYLNASDPSGMMDLTTLEIDRNEDTLVTLYKNKVNYITDFDGKANGYINAQGESKLTVMISNITVNDTGTYTCKALGLDEVGKPVTILETYNVSAHTPDNTTVLHELTQIESQLADLVFQVHELDNRWKHVDRNPLFLQSGELSGSRYLLSRAQMGTMYMAQFICFVQGGYLAEINGPLEFNEVRDFVKGHLDGKKDEYIWLGASDEREESNWTLLYHQEDEAFLEWGSFPSTGYDCLVLSSDTEYYMNDQNCYTNGRVLCEIPL